jgi:hypothetical protein
MHALSLPICEHPQNDKPSKKRPSHSFDGQQKKKTPRFLPSCDSSKQPAKVSKNKKQEQTPS